jgi:YVTN family beta-propeller protein
MRMNWMAVAAALWLGACSTGPAAGPSAPPNPRIYVANESSNNISVIDAVTFKPIGTIDARGHSTHDLALTRDGKRLFATNLASGRVSVVDTDTLETIASIFTAARAHVVAVTNDGRQVWVANIGNDTVSIIDVAAYRILGTIHTGAGPTGLTFSRDGKFAYVSNQGDRTVAVVDTETHQIVKVIPVGVNPHFLVLGLDGRIWGANTGGNDVYVIDPATQELVASLAVGPSPQQIAFGFKGIVGPNAYVTIGGTNKVAVVSTDVRGLRVLEEIDVGVRPNGIWANPQGTRMFIVHEGSNDLRVLDTGTNEIVAQVPVGRKPIRVVVSR